VEISDVKKEVGKWVLGIHLRYVDSTLEICDMQILPPRIGF